MLNTIFVQIASYMDPQLIPTLKHMIENAKHPENLKVCVCWQHATEEDIEIFLDAGFDIEDVGEDTKKILLTYKKAQIKLLDVNHWDSEGACWARNKIQQEYNDEKYTLQLDSHHRFVPHWDKIVIDMLESLREQSAKPILTAYIPSFDPENDPAGRVQEPWQMDFDRFIPEGAVFFMPATMTNWKDRELPMRARFYSAHFAFADGHFSVAVQHDSFGFFHGEEISISARAYTHGYDLYHPNKIIAWHEYTRKNRTKIWDNHTTTEKIKGKIKLDWVERNNAAHLRNRTLFGMDGLDPNSIDFGKYGFGTERTLKDYEEYAGISFKYRGVQQCVLDKIEPIADYKRFDNEDDWKDSITRSNDHRILLHKTKDLDAAITDYDFWYVGVHDADGKEIYRKDKVQPEINSLISGSHEWIDVRFIYLSNHIAKTYTVWPHSISKGWCDKLTKNID